jgi:peptidyl-prolyl cis-trans isomerase C
MKAIALALAALLSAPALAEDVQHDVTLVEVNQQKLTERHFLALAQMDGLRPEQLAAPQQQNALMNTLVTTAMVAQEAEKAGLGKNPDVLAQIDIARMQYLAQAQIRTYGAALKIDDAEVQKLYAEKYSTDNLKEYSARHILSESKEKSLEALAELKSGKEFAEVAKSHSKDTSAAEGGDLGWFSRAQVVKEFGDAAAALTKGSYTQEPVQSSFGWHLIKLDDLREQTAPAMDTAKAELDGELRQRAMLAYLDELKQKAKIEVAAAARAPEPAPAPAPAPATDQPAPAAAAAPAPAESAPKP